MGLLNEIGVKHGTDKSTISHGYLDFYESKIPRDIELFLEIGVEHGESVLMWQEYFGKEKINIHVIDLFINPEFKQHEWCKEVGITGHKGDQSDFSLLSSIETKFDVIIDDGSHRADHQLSSFVYLFFNNLKSGGIYFIEDTHCNKDPFFWGGVTSFDLTPLGIFTKQGPLPAAIREGIESVEIFEDKIIMIKKK